MVPSVFDRRPAHAQGLIVRKSLTGAVIIAASLRIGAFAQQPSDPYLPPGEGRDRVTLVCTSCHGARTFGQLREGARGWRNHVNDMMQHGAQIVPADVDVIVNYLSTALGPGVPLPEPPPAKVTLADGKGKELVEGLCQLCHGLDRVVATKRSAQEWDQILARMTFYGAPLSPEHSRLIVSYLGRTTTIFGTIPNSGTIPRLPPVKEPPP